MKRKIDRQIERRIERQIDREICLENNKDKRVKMDTAIIKQVMTWIKSERDYRRSSSDPLLKSNF